MHNFTVEYLFNGERRTHQLELKQDNLATHDAALHLIMLHHGDGENSLVMPDSDATPAEVLEQAVLLGISEVNVVI
ncbi:hypothetical protein [Pseudomonas shirazensis]|uniref:hypothetical protein n=1 Tax=Pseudomonas shirazensis TaxID=2745494 RepID=UPI003D2CEE38